MTSWGLPQHVCALMDNDSLAPQSKPVRLTRLTNGIGYKEELKNKLPTSFSGKEVKDVLKIGTPVLIGS